MTTSRNGTGPHPLLKAMNLAHKQHWMIIPLHSVTSSGCDCGRDTCASVGKHPRFKDWTNSGSTNPNVLRQWDTDWPCSNAGVLTGTPSGVFVLDIDPKNGGDEALHELERQHGELPHTVRSITGSGGTHFYFNLPDGITITNSTGKLPPGIDVRGTGGQAVLPPFLNANGRYEWDPAAHPDATEVVDAPDWLIELITGGAEPTTTEDTPHGGTVIVGSLPVGRDALEFVAMGAPIGKQRERALAAARNFLGARFSVEQTVDRVRQGLRNSPQDPDRAAWTESDVIALVKSIAAAVPKPVKALAQEGAPTLAPDYSDATAEHPQAIAPIDWRTFWATDHATEDWLLEPVLPRNRAVALYAPAKVGKSLLALDLAAALATGQAVLNQPAGDPVVVVYLDLEMTAADLAERLEDMGYGPESDFAQFHYYLLPALPPLDTPNGGEAVLAIVRHHDAAVVIIDTTSRVLSGKEDAADTLRAFFINTGMPLKAAGVTVLRVDHAGKDLKKGQRGTSAKADDVDVVWELSARDKGFRLRATHRRQSWVPEVVELVRRDEPLRHALATDHSWPSGTKEAAQLLDALDVPKTASSRAAQRALRDAGKGMRRDVVTAAVRWRQRGVIVSQVVPGTTPEPPSGTTDGNHSENRIGNHFGNHPEPPSPDIGNQFPPLRGEPVPSPANSPCYTCGSTAYWTRADGGRVCGTCHPQPELLVREWDAGKGGDGMTDGAE